MKFGVFCIRDVLTGFMSPTIDTSKEVSVRNFSVAISNGVSLVHARPQDFDLYKIGEFDSETGVITGFVVPEMICSGSSLMEVKKDENP